MRTTVTVDEDVAAAMEQLARDRGVSVEEALNSSVRPGSPGSRQLTRRPAAGGACTVPSRPMGLRPGVDLDKALRLSGELEDEELVRKLDLRT